jgi:hypothetical protein
MNPATGSTATNLLQNGAFGNAIPMFGTGQIGYAQVGVLLPKKILGEKNGQLMPYLSGTYADYTALNHKHMLVFDAGLNWFITGHRSKLSLDYQNRPTYLLDANSEVQAGARKGSVTLQYQITF